MLTIYEKRERYLKQREWCAKNPERNKEYKDRWRANNKDKIREGYERNKDKYIARAIKWQKENPEKVAISKKIVFKKWYEKMKIERPEYIRFRNNLHYARKKKATGNHTYEEWETLKQSTDYSCTLCFKKELDIKLTQDHIIPLSKSGTNYIDNIQPLCKTCNNIKYNKIYVDNL